MRRYRFVAPEEHPKSAAHAPKHPLVPLRDGVRDLTLENELMERDGLLVLADHESVVRLDLSPESVEFLLDCLPEGDRFTESLRYARDVARFKLWNDRVSR